MTNTSTPQCEGKGTGTRADGASPGVSDMDRGPVPFPSHASPTGTLVLSTARVTGARAAHRPRYIGTTLHGPSVRHRMPSRRESDCIFAQGVAAISTTRRRGGSPPSEMFREGDSPLSSRGSSPDGRHGFQQAT
jgi:hypothetical protein